MRTVFEQLERNNEAKVALKALNDSYKVTCTTAITVIGKKVWKNSIHFTPV